MVALAFEAGAAPKDAGALRLDREAMDNDYLTNNWSGAETKLRKALRDCGTKACAAKVRAQVELHLGIILVNAGKTAEAGAAFGEALRLNPASTPETDFANPDVLKAFEEAKRKAGLATATAEPDPGPSSDLTHAPVAEQAVGAPVPIYAEGDASAARMVLYYRGAAGADFVKLEMRRAGKGFRAVVPCRDTAAAGTVGYYIIALDAKGDPVGGAGSRRDPYQVAIKARIDGPAPRFPGEAPLAACPQGASCPAGLAEPGCDGVTAAGAATPGGRGAAGASCSDAAPCGEGLACEAGVCRAPGKPKAPGAYKKNWLSVSASLDVAIVSGDDLCSL
ncbi:MAG TPA: hypothetical protein VFS00_02870, partial [Polyangiaceae bacterium]|nr:hypothetical protein [Polyangiaceae bacterium]